MPLCPRVLGFYASFLSFLCAALHTPASPPSLLATTTQHSFRIGDLRWSHSSNRPLHQPLSIPLTWGRPGRCAHLPIWRHLHSPGGLEMVQSYLSHNHRDFTIPPGRTKRFHAGDLRLLKRHGWGSQFRPRLAFHVTRISDAAEKLSCREYISWLQAEYPREVFSRDKFERLPPLASDTSLLSRDADLQLLEGALARYSPSTMIQLNEDTWEVVKVIMKALRRFQTDLYVPEIRNTLQSYSIRTSLKWLYDSLYHYKGWGLYSYPQPIELTVGDRSALQAAIRYYNPDNFMSDNEGAVPMVTLIRAYLRWYLWKLERRRRHGSKMYLVVKNWRTYTWRPRLDPIRE